MNDDVTLGLLCVVVANLLMEGERGLWDIVTSALLIVAGVMYLFQGLV